MHYCKRPQIDQNKDHSLSVQCHSFQNLPVMLTVPNLHIAKPINPAPHLEPSTSTVQA